MAALQDVNHAVHTALFDIFDTEKKAGCPFCSVDSMLHVSIICCIIRYISMLQHPRYSTRGPYGGIPG